MKPKGKSLEPKWLRSWKVKPTMKTNDGNHKSSSAFEHLFYEDSRPFLDCLTVFRGLTYKPRLFTVKDDVTIFCALRAKRFDFEE
eukprot:4409535-Amphidinium_carterae.1